MCVHVCYDNVFVLQLHVEGVQVHSDVRQKIRRPSEDYSDEESWRSPSAGRTHGTAWLVDSASELNKSNLKQISVLHVDIVIQCLKLAVIQARERMELTTFTTTDMPSTRLADLAHRQSLVVNE